MKFEITKPGEEWMLEIFDSANLCVKQEFFTNKDQAEKFAATFVFNFECWNGV